MVQGKTDVRSARSISQSGLFLSLRYDRNEWLQFRLRNTMADLAKCTPRPFDVALQQPAACSGRMIGDLSHVSAEAAFAHPTGSAVVSFNSSITKLADTSVIGTRRIRR